MKYRILGSTAFLLFVFITVLLWSHMIDNRRDTEKLLAQMNIPGEPRNHSSIPIDSIIEALCAAYKLSTGLCCSRQAILKHSVISWFECMRVSNVIPNTKQPKKPSNLYRDWLQYSPPEYRISERYFLEPAESNTMQNRSNRPCPVVLDDRARGYRLLRYWMELAQEHNIVWWISYGTLLGADRDGEYIPWDNDVDVNILDAFAPLVEKVAVKREDINTSNINVIARDVQFCPTDKGPRWNCAGMRVWHQSDRCAFCLPLVRLVTETRGFFDVFVTRFNTSNSAEPQARSIGLQEERFDVGRGRPVSYQISDVFPLSTCRFMNLDVPCPRNTSVILRFLYGRNYHKPHQYCNMNMKKWVYMR